MEKLDRLGRFLADRDLDSVWFARPNAFAWLTGGSNVVDRSTDAGVAAIGYDGTTVTLLADTIEVDRILAEELPDFDEAPWRDELVVETFPWHESSLGEAIADVAEGPAAADVAGPDLATIDPTPLRQPLTARDRDRYRALGEEVASAVEAVSRELRPEDTEHEVACAIRVALEARGIEAPVVLVGGADRLATYRHFTATDAPLGAYATIAVTAKRHGLHASCTRTVAFDPPEWLEERHELACRVETTAIAATKAVATEDGTGGTAGDVFAAIRRAYDAVDWAGEWRNHHQGGAAGFSGREWIATPTLDAGVFSTMAYAWNPTVDGAKSEDTVLVTDGDVEILTETGGWPSVTVDALDVEGATELTLERPAVLSLEN